MKGSTRNGVAAACLLMMSCGVSIQAQQESATSLNADASAQAAAASATSSPKSTSEPSPFSTIVGAGATGFMPLWTGNYTIQNSSLFQSGGNLGIGTTTPAGPLDIEGPAAPNNTDAPPVLNVVGGTGGWGQFYGRIGGSVMLTGGTGGASSLADYGAQGGNISLQGGLGGYGCCGSPGPTGNVILAPQGGMVGIQTTLPNAVLTIARGAGHAVADGWDTWSSRRWKTNIETLPGALEKVERLRGVSYDRKDTGKHEIGVIAEEVGPVVPEVVSYEKDGVTPQGVDYARLTALLIEGMKEQQREITRQQQANKVKDAQIRLLSREVHQLQGVRLAMTALQARIDHLECVQHSGANLTAQAPANSRRISPISSTTKTAF